MSGGVGNRPREAKRPKILGPGRIAGAEAGHGGTGSPEALDVVVIKQDVSVSIDLGHSHTGVAINDKTLEIDATAFGADFPWRGATEAKVPSKLLLDRESPHPLLAFGREAEKRWAQGSEHLLFEDYKMRMDVPMDYGERQDVEDKIAGIFASSKRGTGRNSEPVELPLILLITRVYEAIHAAVTEYAKTHGITLEGRNIVYINTLPVQFKDIAKVTGRDFP